jgi:hypothetical protein
MVQNLILEVVANVAERPSHRALAVTWPVAVGVQTEPVTSEVADAMASSRSAARWLTRRRRTTVALDDPLILKPLLVMGNGSNLTKRTARGISTRSVTGAGPDAP